MRDPNFYATGGIDRAAERRKDTVWIADQYARPDARLVPVWQAKNLVRDDSTLTPVFPTTHDIAGQDRKETVFLGLVDGVPHFAQDFSNFDDPPLGEWGTFQDLRAFGPLLERRDGALLAYARGMLTWHARHRFCGLCGSPTAVEDAGHLRVCRNADCRTNSFPRTDPAVIMLVHDGGDRAILGRQKIWPQGMHSVLAGFVEPGESLEDAVAREVLEEVGVPVEDVTYHSSQPWPFPASIMLGFWARAVSDDLDVNTFELESARWVTRREMRASPEDTTFRLPRRDSIARRLVEDWLAA